MGMAIRTSSRPEILSSSAYSFYRLGLLSKKKADKVRENIEAWTAWEKPGRDESTETFFHLSQSGGIIKL
jgi:hypothetical protein